METVKEILKALAQIAIYLIALPLWVIVGAWCRISRKDKFRCLARVAGVDIFPAFGRWWLPLVWL